MSMMITAPFDSRINLITPINRYFIESLNYNISIFLVFVNVVGNMMYN